MFNLLIVDDNTERIYEIKQIIEKLELEISVDYVMEVRQALTVLEKKFYDLMILDVQLPSLNNRGGIMAAGGVSILDSVMGLDTIIKPVQIIGITAYDDKFDDVKREFDKRLWHLIKYQKGNTDWEKYIADKIRYAYQSRNQFLKYNSIREVAPKIDCAIITAVPNEWNELFALGLEWTEYKVQNDPTTYYWCTYKTGYRDINIVIAKQGQMGMSAAATLTTKIINTFSPQLVCMVGIAAGCKGEVDLGDLIVVNESWDYGSGKIIKGDDGSLCFKQETHQLSISSSVKELLSKDYTDLLYEIRKKWNSSHGIEVKTDITVHVGAMASGASVVQNEDLVTEYVLPQNRKLLGLDMETYGVYYAAKNASINSVEVLSIKAVSDFADSQKNDDYQHYGSYVSINFVMELLPEILNVTR